MIPKLTRACVLDSLLSSSVIKSSGSACLLSPSLSRHTHAHSHSGAVSGGSSQSPNLPVCACSYRPGLPAWGFGCQPSQTRAQHAAQAHTVQLHDVVLIARWMKLCNRWVKRCDY